MFDGDLLAERARVTPDRLALVSVETGERLTYRQLSDRAEGAAGVILAAGIGPGDRFGILGHNSVDYLAFFFGAGRTGGIVVPLSTRATAHELEIIAADCGMRVLFFSDDFADLGSQLSVVGCRLSVPAAPAATFVRSTPHPPAAPSPLEGEKGLKRGVLAGLPHRDPSPPLAGEKVPKADEGVEPEPPYALLYTSGTTGKPKGVMIPRRQLLANGYNTVINWGLRDSDITPVFTPAYHAGGLAAFLIPIFCVGGTVVLHKGFNPSEVWRTIEKERCTVVLGVPTIWKMLMDAPEFAGADLSHIRWLISGGAPLPAFIIDAYQQRGVVFKQGYGMTEVGVNCFTMTEEESVRRPGSIGRPLLFTEVELRDVDEHGVGEMYIRGPHVSSGYWNNAAATSEAYLEGGWFRTGDLARRDEEGFFFIAGRRKEMFISGGVNVYPAEIEAELVSHPAVNDAAVVAVPDETWGEVCVAFVVAEGLTGDELGEYLALRISKHKIPKQFLFLDSLPRTPYGKVEKVKLRERLP